MRKSKADSRTKVGATPKSKPRHKITAQASRKTTKKQTKHHTAKTQGRLAPAFVETGYKVRDQEMERILITGSHEGILEEYLGQQNYQELRELAQQSSRRSVRGGPRVLILPGIMGSKIGRERSFLFDDVIWIDPCRYCVRPSH